MYFEQVCIRYSRKSCIILESHLYAFYICNSLSTTCRCHSPNSPCTISSYFKSGFFSLIFIKNVKSRDHSSNLTPPPLPLFNSDYMWAGRSRSSSSMNLLERKSSKLRYKEIFKFKAKKFNFFYQIIVHR